MGNKVYIRTMDNRSLISLSEATPDQKMFCDRVVMNKHREVVREITPEELQEFDIEMAISPKPRGIVSLGDLLKAKQQAQEVKELRKLFPTRGGNNAGRV